MVAMRRIVLVGVVLIGLSLIPIPYLASPAWDVSVVDDTGQPVRGVTVRLSYQNYSAERRSHEEDRIPNESGVATFPRRESSASIMERCYYTVLSARAGVHSSFGRHAGVFAFGKGLEGTATSGAFVTDWTGSPDHMESRIEVNPTNLPPAGNRVVP
jgi:hypothetical protein